MRRVLLALFAATALVAAGCGSDNNESGSPGAEGVGSTKGTEVNDDAKKGGDVTYLSAGDVDYMDPGQTYYTFGSQIHKSVGRPLFNYQIDDASKVVPDLADGEAQVSEDNKTVTVKIKSGIRYAPPVDREVTSADVKYAIERAFTTSVVNGYTQYFGDIIGAPDSPVKYAERKPFEGIETPDDRTIVFKLDKPTAGQLVAAMVMPITIPVPEDYAGKFDQEVPTQYTEYMTSSGPYMVKNDPETGELTGYDVGKKIEIVRNPNWDPETDERPAYLDSITIEEGNSDETVASRRILTGQSLIGSDYSVPPAPILREILTSRQEQYGRVPSGGAHYDSLNTTKAPFDNLNVRKAVNAIVNRDALRAIQGGEAIGPIQQTLIPPGMPGFEESGGLEGFPELDFLASETGDEQVARKYMDLAEEDGADVSNGKYTGSEEIDLAVNNTPDGSKHAQSLAADLQKLGFQTNIRQVTQDTLYSKVCAVPKQTPHMCVGVGWVKDFQDASTMLQPTFSGDAIKNAGNVNWPLLDDPKINQAMVKAAELEIGPERDQAWADVNKMIMEQAPVVPNTWDDQFAIASENVAGVINGDFGGWDFSYTSLK